VPSHEEVLALVRELARRDDLAQPTEEEERVANAY
jgi:hypothetical protein